MALKQGNSVIELTVVIGLISLLAIAMSAIMLTTITSSNRVRLVTRIKQAGDYTLGSIQTQIRNAREVTSCDSSLDELIYTGQDGGSTTLTLETNSTIARIASNSGVFLTPSNLNISNFNITCEPSDTEPTTIKIDFDATDTVNRGNVNPSLHFETTIGLRNNN